MDPNYPSSTDLDQASVPGLYARYQAARAVCTDTRILQPGDLFIALKGPNFNGNLYAAKALEMGASTVLLDEAPDEPGLASDQRVLVVPFALRAMQALAREHRRSFGFPVFSLTGSNGKTTTKELIAEVLGKRFRVSATKGNLNNHIGVPLTLLAVPAEANMAVVEMGANAQGEIAGLAAIAEPDAGLITNIGDAHLEGFGGHAGVKKGKGELFTFLKGQQGPLFCWWDQAEIRELAGDYSPVIRYGSDPDYAVSGSALAAERFAAVRLAFGRTAEREPVSLELHTHLVGDYNIPNLLAAAAVGQYYGVAPHEVVDALADYRPANQRSEWRTHGQHALYLDAYNANPSSMRAALASLGSMPENSNKPQVKGAILGDMLELGAYEQTAHQAMADFAGSLGLDMLVFIGPRFGNAKLPSGARHFADATAAGAWLSETNPSPATWLLKGSRSIGVERVLEAWGG